MLQCFSSSNIPALALFSHTCITRILSVRWISVSLASFFLRAATVRSMCSLCLAYSECTSVSAECSPWPTYNNKSNFETCMNMYHTRINMHNNTNSMYNYMCIHVHAHVTWTTHTCTWSIQVTYMSMHGPSYTCACTCNLEQVQTCHFVCGMIQSTCKCTL